jgi:sec-independent protein translocase protein TatB
MEFLNIGSAELLFLLLIAILVVGPRRAAELASQSGRLMARLRREWNSVRRDLMAEVASLEQEAALEDKNAQPSQLMAPGEKKSTGPPRRIKLTEEENAVSQQTIEPGEDKVG